MDTISTLSNTSQPHYPSVVSYGSWLVLSNGRGQLYLLEWLGERYTLARLVGSWIHDTNTGTNTTVDHSSTTVVGQPCTLLDMIISPATQCLQLLVLDANQATLSDNVDGNNNNSTSGIYRNKRATKDTQKQTAKQFRINLMLLDITMQAMPVCRLAHQIVSREPSVYAYFNEPQVYIVGGRVPWTPIQTNNTASTITSEMMTNNNGSNNNRSTIAHSTQPSYTWTQTEDDRELTMYIILDRSVLSRQISCEFTATTIHLDIMDGLDPLLWMQRRTLYDRIIPTECLWTLESGCLLTLHLQREGKSTGGVSRWPHVFTEDDGVLETLDPSVLAEIRDQMAKLTSQYSTTTTTAAQQQQPMLTHVLSDPLEAEDEEGDSIIFYRVIHRLTSPIMTHCIKSGTQDWLALGTRPSLNIDITNTITTKTLPAICLRQDIDGLVYELGSSSNHEGDLYTRHAATFDAFGFVQASKRDRRFSLFSSRAHYMVIVETRHRLYVYRRATTRHSQHATQYIINLTNDTSDILGVQTIDEPHEQILVLTEKALHRILLMAN